MKELRKKHFKIREQHKATASESITYSTEYAHTEGLKIKKQRKIQLRDDGDEETSR